MLKETKHIKTESGKDIFVYDNVFSYQERRDLYAFVMDSFYKVVGADSKTNTNFLKDYQIYSSYSDEDLINMGFFKSNNIRDISNKHDLSFRQKKQIRVNVSHIGEKNKVHTDGNGLTLLYYANLQWDLDWSGHTMFLTEDGKDCEFLSVNKPGRVVVFDGSIPHCILSPTILSPIHRFTFAVQYDPI